MPKEQKSNEQDPTQTCACESSEPMRPTPAQVAITMQAIISLIQNQEKVMGIKFVLCDVVGMLECCKLNVASSTMNPKTQPTSQN